MTGPAKRWPPDLLRKFRELYPVMPTREVARRLGLTYEQARSQASNLGLRKTAGLHARHNWTEAQLHQLRSEYADTPTEALADRLGLDLQRVYRKAHSMGLCKSAAYMDSLKGRDRGQAGERRQKITVPAWPCSGQQGTQGLGRWRPIRTDAIPAREHAENLATGRHDTSSGRRLLGYESHRFPEPLKARLEAAPSHAVGGPQRADSEGSYPGFSRRQ